MRKKIATISYFFTLVLVLCFVFAPTKTQAVPKDITLRSYPKAPAPKQDVSLELISYDTNLDGAKISWYEDGKLVLSGVGETRHSFTMKELGGRTKFNIYIQSGGFKQIQITKTFASSKVDMLWEAVDSYTPPFYKGKALPSSQAKIRVTAVPSITSLDGSKANPNKLIYKWKRNNKYRDFNKQSGYNRKTVEFNQDLFGLAEEISVEVYSDIRDASSIGKININKTQPEILIYHSDPLEGVVYEKAIRKDFFMDNKEVELVAEPYFFSTDKKGDDLIFSWRVNNKKLRDDISTARMNFGFEKESVGSSKISLEVKHPKKILQLANAVFKLNYGNDTGFFNTLF